MSVATSSLGYNLNINLRSLPVPTAGLLSPTGSDHLSTESPLSPSSPNSNAEEKLSNTAPITLPSRPPPPAGPRPPLSPLTPSSPPLTQSSGPVSPTSPNTPPAASHPSIPAPQHRLSLTSSSLPSSPTLENRRSISGFRAIHNSSSAASIRSEKKTAPTVVSRPENVQRVLHVEWDENLQAFTGVPDVWKGLFPQSQNHMASEALPSHVNPAPVLRRGSSISAMAVAPAVPAPEKPNPSEQILHRRGIYPVTDKVKRKSSKSQSLPKNFRPPADAALLLRRPELTMREYLSTLGFTDLDKPCRVDVLRETLLSKLYLGPSGGSFLVRMPFVLKLKVLSYLDAPSLIAACCTCTEFLQFIDHHMLWKPLVHEKNKIQRTLYSEKTAIMTDWRRTFMAMKSLDVDPKRFDSMWNIVVIGGDRRVGTSRLVWSLAESAARANDRRHTVTADDPVINAVSGIYRLGIDLVTRRVVIGSTIIKLQVWDGKALEGNGRVPLKNANVVLVVFDVCNKASFDRLQQVIEDTRKDLEQQKASNERDVVSATPILLFGNLTAGSESKERAVPFKDAKRFANERGLVYIEANANSPESVDSAFSQLAEECINLSVLDIPSNNRVLHQSDKLASCSIQ